MYRDGSFWYWRDWKPMISCEKQSVKVLLLRAKFPVLNSIFQQSSTEFFSFSLLRYSIINLAFQFQSRFSLLEAQRSHHLNYRFSAPVAIKNALINSSRFPSMTA